MSSHYLDILKFNFFFIYDSHREREREREKEREREAETQAEGEAGSMQGAQCGWDSIPDPGITP